MWDRTHSRSSTLSSLPTVTAITSATASRSPGGPGPWSYPTSRSRTTFDRKGCRSHPLHIGGAAGFPFGRIKLTIAHHGSTGPDGEALGSPAGIVLTIGSRTIYHAGDTGLFLDMKLIAEMNGPIDAALLPIGDNFTMGIDDAVKAAEFLDARVTIPMHYGTFPSIASDPLAFVERVKAQGTARGGGRTRGKLRTRVRPPRSGSRRGAESRGANAAPGKDR